jgi:hypothetical protein
MDNHCESSIAGPSNIRSTGSFRCAKWYVETVEHHRHRKCDKIAAWGQTAKQPSKGWGSKPPQLYDLKEVLRRGFLIFVSQVATKIKPRTCGRSEDSDFVTSHCVVELNWWVSPEKWQQSLDWLIRVFRGWSKSWEGTQLRWWFISWSCRTIWTWMIDGGWPNASAIKCTEENGLVASIANILASVSSTGVRRPTCPFCDSFSRFLTDEASISCPTHCKNLNRTFSWARWVFRSASFL